MNCYQWGSCVGGLIAFNSPFGHRSRSHNICPLDNHLSGLSISLSSLVLSWVYRLPLPVFGIARLWLELATSRSGGEYSTFTLPVGQIRSIVVYNLFLPDCGRRIREFVCCISCSTRERYRQGLVVRLHSGCTMLPTTLGTLRQKLIREKIDWICRKNTITCSILCVTNSFVRIAYASYTPYH